MRLGMFRPEAFVEVDRTPTRTDLQLLTRVRFRDAMGEERECFGNILELGPRMARLESGRPLESGSHLVVQVVFPGQRGYARSQVHLNFIVRGAHDEANLQYDLETTVLDKESHERLALYLSRETTSRSEAS
jgi:hypothetical protein